MAIKDLLVKTSEIGEIAAEDIIKPYVNFTENGEIVFSEHYWNLKSEEKIAVALVAKDSWRFIDGKENLASGMSNEELGKATLLTGNTVRPVVKSLRDSGLIKTEKSIHYPTAKLVLNYRKRLSIKNKELNNSSN